MIINVDVSTGVVVQGGSMIELALSFFKQRVDNVQFLANLRPFDKTALERYLRGVKFVTHDDPNARPGAVKALTRESAEGYMFEKDGQRISVAVRFKVTSYCGRMLICWLISRNSNIIGQRVLL